MKNYEPLEITLITFVQDVVTFSGNDDFGGTPGDWED